MTPALIRARAGRHAMVDPEMLQAVVNEYTSGLRSDPSGVFLKTLQQQGAWGAHGESPEAVAAKYAQTRRDTVGASTKVHTTTRDEL